MMLKIEIFVRTRTKDVYKYIKNINETHTKNNNTNSSFFQYLQNGFFYWFQREGSKYMDKQTSASQTTNIMYNNNLN